MQWQFTPYFLPLLIMSGVTLVVAVAGWRNRSAPSMLPFSALMTAVFVWLAGYTLELSSATVEAALFWSRVQYLSITTVPVLWLLFALHYTGNGGWQTPVRLAALLIVPITTVLLNWFASIGPDALIWTKVEPVNTANFLVLEREYGLFFWVHTAYSYTLTLAGAVVFFWNIASAPQLYRGQALFIIMAVFIAFGANITTLFFNPFPLFDLTPFSFGISLLPLAWALFRYRLLNVTPIARNIVMQGMTDAVVVLDSNNMVVDMNPAAEEATGHQAAEVIGKSAQILFPADASYVAQLASVEEANTEIVIPGTDGEPDQKFDVRISPLRNNAGQFMGRVIVWRSVGDLQRTQAALEASENRFQAVFENAPVAISVASVQGAILDANPEFREILGYEDTAGMTWANISHPEEVTSSIVMFRDIVMGKQDFVRLERRLLHHDGHYIWADGALFALRDEEGWTQNVIAIINDITEEREARQALISRNLMLETLNALSTEAALSLEVGPLLDMVVQLTTRALDATSGYILDWNPETGEATVLTEYIGPEANEKERVSDLGTTYNLYKDFDDTAEWLNEAGEHLVAHLDDEDLSERERDHMRRYGTNTTLSVPLFGQDKPLGFIELWDSRSKREFTEQEIQMVRAIARQASLSFGNALLHETLAHSEERYRTILESIEDGYYEGDLEGKIIFFNDAFLRIFGYAPADRESLTGVPYASLMDEASAKLSREAANKAFTTGESTQVLELAIFTKEGEQRYVETSFTARHGDDGKPTGSRGIIRDVTARKKAEEQNIQQNQALLIANIELAEAREAAEESARVKSEFLATMSHELRTPLNAVIGYADLVLQGVGGDLSDKQSDFIERILSNGERLLSLIDDVLDLSKIEAGRLELINKPFGPTALLERLQAQMQGLADKQGIALIASVDSDVPAELVGDPVRLEQIVVNLMSNAIKFTDEGHVKVHFAKDGADHWRIEVEDTGIGIPPHAQEYIFDEFRQADSSSLREYGGTGLGLSIVRRLVLMMDGTIRVHSEVGKGSTFTVRLPIAEPEPDKAG